MKRAKKVLSLLLVVCMLFGMTGNVYAADTTQTTSETGSDDFYKIVHLDCGRKYFTVDWVKSLIDEMAKDGYTHLELAFGNDGLRFLLDDMSVTVGDTTYSSADVTAGVKAGNKAYYDAGTNEWTQSEMDAIITAANDAGIQIIPLVNTPGHMDAIIDAMEAVGISGSYNGSARTVDVTNDTAVAFTQALVEKYVSYFAAKGCKVFNIGADEYANDIYSSGGMGFGQLSSSGKYGSFVTYVNGLAAIIKDAGMTPMAFNDGIYYNSTTSYGTFDKDIMIAYWSPGWSGYNVASAKYLANQGHKLINTHGDFYYVLGKDDKFDNGSSYASNWNNKVFAGTTTGTTFDEEPAGAMFCIWCDYPGAETEAEITSKVIDEGVLSAMSEKMGHEKTEEVVNATVTNDESTISVTGPGLTSIATNKVATPSYSAEGATVVGYDITPYVNGVAYTGSGSVTIAVPDELKDFSNIKVYDVEKKTFVTSSVSNGMITFNATHFSEYDVVGYADSNTGSEIVPDETITLEVGGTATRTHEGKVDIIEGTEPNTDIAVVDVNFTQQSAGYTATKKSSLSQGDQIVISDGNGNYIMRNGTSIENTKDPASATVWTVGVDGDYYTLSNNNYYLRSKSGNINYTLNISNSSKNTSYRRWSYDENTGFYYYNEYRTRYLKYSDGWIYDTGSATSYGAAYTLKEQEAVNGTTITFTGVAPGTTYVTVGETTYKIVVNYKKATVNAIVGESSTVTVSGNADTSALKTDIAKVSVSGNTMTVTGVAEGETTVTVGNTIYTIIVTEEDLSKVDSLTLEYWITNGRPTDDAGNSDVSITATNAHSEAGLSVTDIAPTNTTKETRTLQYWRCRLLDKNLNNNSTNGTEEQTETAGDDDTYNGVEFTKVRYWNGNWSVYTENNEWVNVKGTHQLVAYYLEILPVADELTVTAADWGKKGDGSTSGDYLVPSSSCTVSVQVVYEDGTTNPVSTEAADLNSRTIAYGYWNGGRGVGTLNLTGLEGYQIWKVEAETGAETYASSSSTWGSYTVNGFSWDNNPMTVYEGDPVDSYIIHNDAHNPSTDGYYQNLMWDENNEAILIKVYVKAKPTDDNLKVVYYDEKFGDELYSYNINVNSGVNFNDDIDPAPSTFADNTERIDVTNCGITNTLNVTQKFQTDLTKVPEAIGKYNSDLYSYTGSVISEDGKTLYLYYNINTEVLSPMFVVDFGLPFTFKLSQVVNDTSTVKSVTVNEKTRYGTLTYDEKTKEFTYTPTQVLPNIDVLTINVLFDGETSAATTNAGVMPATTVYYEEGFADFPGDTDNTKFKGGSTGSSKQKAQVAGNSSDNYGYDVAYEKTGASEGTQATSTTFGATAEFTFTGTGVDIYTNSTSETGKLFIQVKDPVEGYTIKIVQVETALKDGGAATTGQAGNGYNVPVASLDLKDYGTYTVVIKHMKSTNDKSDTEIASVNLDGFRVYGTLEETSAIKAFYENDLEDSPKFIELRDKVLAGLDVDSAGKTYKADSVYAKELAGNTLAQVYASASPTEGTVVLSTNETFNSSTDVQDLLDNGPKNEIYLQPSQSLVFKVTTNREVQIGLKALNEGTKYTVNGGGEKTLNSSTDMFYSVLNKTEGDPKENTITITNKGDGILSITKLKICDDPNATFEKLTEDDLTDAFVALGIIEKEPETGKDENIKDEDNKKPETGKDENIKDEDNKKPETGKDENIKDEDNKKQEQDKIKEQIKQYKAKKVRVKNVKSTKKNTAKVEWRTISGSRGYQIQYSKKSNFKSAKRVTVVGSSKKTATLKKLSSKTRYYVRVRAYKTINGKKVYTSWSTRKSVKVK